MSRSDFNLLSLIFPQSCAECDNFSSSALCDKCLKKLKRITSYTCERCGKPLGSCVCKGLSPKVERNVSAFNFEDPCIAALVYKLKSRGTKITADFLGKKLAQRIKEEYKDVNFDLITHVPVTRRQIAKSGYDHAGLIAKAVAVELGIPFVRSPILKRQKMKQKYLDVSSRRKNAPKLFYLKRNSSLFGNVLLVDDVMTTGSTFSACSELLASVGADKIYCASVASAVKK